MGNIHQPVDYLARGGEVMANPILETKLRVPRPRRGLLARSRLVDRLTGGSEAPLALVSAPAGSGKTTLLADWASAPGVHGSVAWLSLDPDDNVYETFWTYVVAALQTLAPSLGAGAVPFIERSQAPTSDPALTTLLNDLNAHRNEVRLVVDDYHFVDSTDIQDSLAFFLDHLPENVQLLISTRSDPALPLANLRAKGELVEIRAADLHFTQDEADSYLTELMGLSLTAQQVTALEERTEGWAAALQLAALSMQGVDDISGFITAFAGSQRFVVDYLVEEVLDRQREQVRDFLVQTSILSRLTGRLCDAVSGQADSAATLEALERDNLLIVPLDSQRRWYRYHHLFADVLQARLRDEHPDLVRPLHIRASDWYEEAGDLPEAITHALAAEDYDGAADLVEKAIPSLRMTRDEATLRKWFEALPPDLFADRPVLSVGYVGALLAAGELAGVERLLQLAERWIDPNAEEKASDSRMVVANDKELRRMPSAIALYRAALARMAGDDAGTLAHANRAVELADAADHLERGGAAGFLALTHWTRGDLDAAFHNWAEAMSSLGKAGHTSDVIGCTLSMADIRITQGRLSEALTIYERGLRLATEPGPAHRGAADMHVGIGEILRERNDLAGAREHLRSAKELGDGNGLPQNLYRSRVLQALIQHAEGDLEGALDLLTEAEQLYFTDFAPEIRPVSAQRAKLLVAAGRLAEARRWASQRGLSLADDLSYVREFEHVTLARVFLAEAQIGRGDAPVNTIVEFLERLQRAAEDGGRIGSSIEILVVAARAHLAADDTDTAVGFLNRAIALGEPEGFTRVFLDEGAGIVPLLKLATADKTASEHARLLLAEMGAPARTTPAPQNLVDPLTERELEVLRLLSTDLSGPDIARELYVSLNTMRTHTKSIYTKLGVSSRRAAVRRAAELEILP